MYDFPNTLCFSPNDQVVHGIPTGKALKNGDIVSIDCGVLMNGFYGDHAYTFEVGEVDEETKKLLQVTKEALYLGIEQFKTGKRVSDIGNAIQKYTEGSAVNGVVRRNSVGKRVLGRKLDEDPAKYPITGRPGRGKKF